MTGDLFQGGLLDPLVPAQTRCFEGATQSFRGAKPPQAPL